MPHLYKVIISFQIATDKLETARAAAIAVAPRVVAKIIQMKRNIIQI